jgi:S-disulfanyl-L-cysteine oxidoreductase SoxD
MALNGGAFTRMGRSLVSRLSMLAVVCPLTAFLLLAQTKDRKDSIGHMPTPKEIHNWDAAILPDGKGLPVGNATPSQGEHVYLQKCAACHGNRGEGREAIAPKLVGGIGTLGTKNPVFTVGSYWPYSTSLWDYIHRAMPYQQPGSLSANDTYAVTGYILYLNGIVPREAVMNQRTLPKVRMPNREGFVPAPRPDVAGTGH